MMIGLIMYYHTLTFFNVTKIATKTFFKAGMLWS